ncbi:hypothetical protein AOC36_02930 [Erysipelothrix larvae]|uniref:Cell division protein MukB n=1 Tax=Erysipelothrix larvae TaxID=1514105 RepID=A0A120JTI2_9FIRM|nr:SbcC/MukB-like Walker B domain-containing protein [Erysipelothrix larvae]AMC92971.1 hypothetical protein AOC36_02930 [Erysipelothrix larvae]
MKILKKIKLINWHIFSNETIELSGNTLITGENGSGKSTILDAMQYILTAGSTKFNMAANESSTRTLVSYVRGKLGVEGKEFIRSGDVVSHIALEFYNEESDVIQVLGVVLEVGAQSMAKPHFYKVDQPFEDAWFLEDRKVRNYAEFKQTLKGLQIELDTPTTATQRRTLFMNTMGLDLKYRELIPRALAFRPVNDIQDFIYRYLLNEQNIDIDALRDSIREYRRLEKQLEHEQRYFQKLEIIDAKYTQLKKQEYEVSVNESAIQLLRLNLYKNTIEVNEKQIYGDQQRLKQLAKSKEQANERLGIYQEALADMRKNPTLERLEKLKLALAHAKKEYESNEAILKHVETEYHRLIKTLKSVDFKETIHDGNDVQAIQNQLASIKKAVDQKLKTTYLQKIKYEEEIEATHRTRLELEHDIERLKRQQQVYPENVKKLIVVLKERLSEFYHESVEVRPLFEYLEIKDESWRNAIEGYLNTQRFNIIVEPRYFDMAVKIYDQIKHDMNIYGVRVVDVLKTHGKKALEGSLAQHLTVMDEYVLGYMNYLLGSVICVDSVSNLKEHPISITQEAMVYKGYAVFAIRPEIYKRPYIGQAAIQIQLTQRQEEHKALMQTLIEKRQHKDALEVVENTLESINILNLEVSISGLKDRKTLFETYKLNEDAVNQIQSNPNLTLQLQKAQELEVNIKTLQQEISRSDQAIGGLNRNIAATTEKNEDVKATYEILYDAYERTKDDNPSLLFDAEATMKSSLDASSHNHQRAMDTLQTQNKALSANFVDQKLSLQQDMSEYNHMSNSGYGVGLECIDQYLTRYYKLRDVDLIASRNSCRQAREKSEQQFHDSFIHQLSQNIKQARRNIDLLNRQLRKHTFRDEQYRFDISASKSPHFAQYYKIITSDKEAFPSNLFMQMLSQQESEVMKELFRRITAFDDDGKNEQELRRYTDYRNYMSYDIITTKENGDITRLSTVIKEKSGGETQTPFYVTIAASFEQLISKISMVDSGCVVLFDEAFNNMDSQRIRAMLEFYNNLNIQIVIAVPPDRIASISEHVDTVLAVGRSGNSGFTQRIQYGKNDTQ